MFSFSLYNIFVLYIFMRTIFASSVYIPSVHEQSCTDAGCHEALKKLSVLHPPLDDCSTCHVGAKENHPKGEGKEFKLTSEVPDLCYTCHEKRNPEKNIHPPFASGDCLNCHSPHSSSAPKLIKAKNVGEVCSPCHELDKKQKKSSHKPVLEQKCEQCHDPHQSAQDRLLKTSERVLCLGCHKQMEKENQKAHPPFLEECSSCHRGHFSSQKHLLRSPLPDLCYKCHPKTKELIEQSPVVHQAVKDVKSCSSCHNAHSSTQPSLLVKEEAKVCFQCHGSNSRSADSIVVNISDKVYNSKFVHEPVKSGCNTCHNAHGSKNNYLLNNVFPRGNYTTPNVSSFELCFECHDSQVFSDVKSTTTAFNNGGKNLHYLHVMKEKAMSCADCHDVHGSNEQHLIAGKIYFGKWQMPLNYQQTAKGGSCRPACHANKEYSREKTK